MEFFPALSVSSLCQGRPLNFFVRGSAGLKRGRTAWSLQGAPVLLQAWNRHKKRRSVHTLSLNIKRRIIGAENEERQSLY